VLILTPFTENAKLTHATRRTILRLTEILDGRLLAAMRQRERLQLSFPFGRLNHNAHL